MCSMLRKISKSLQVALRAPVVVLCLTILASGGQLRAQDPNGQETLTNADIIKMVQAHLSTDVIVNQIESNPGNYVLTANGLIRLKQAGVPDKVLAAMQAKRAGSGEKPEAAESPRSGKAATPKPGAPNPYNWDVKDVLDKMTDQHHVEGYLYQHPTPGTAEEMQVKATCDATGMHWLMVYMSGTTPEAGYRRNFPDGGGGGGLVFGGIPGVVTGLVNVFANASRPTGPWVNLQLKIDNHAEVGAISVSDYTNFANLTFASRNPPGSGDPEMDQALRVLGPAQNRPAATIDEIASARKVLVALPREDGSEIYLEIRPQDPSFRDLVARCYSGSPSEREADRVPPAVVSPPSPESQVENYMASARGNSSNGNYAAAINEYNHVLRIQPGNQDAQRGLADAQAAQQQQAEKERLRQIAQLITTAQGNCSQGNFAAAIDSYNRVIGMDQGNQAARNGLAVAQASQQRQVEIIRQQTAASEWVDLQTRLMWTMNDDGKDTKWKEANQYCEELRTGGFSDWRLPSIDELGTIFDRTSTRDTVPLRSTKTYFTGGSVAEDRAGSYWPYHARNEINLTGPAVWSGTPDGYNDIMWMFFYSTGKKDGAVTSYKRETRALCVRPYVAPTETACNSKSAQASQGTQQIQQVAIKQAMAVSSAASAPSLADSYFRQGQALLSQATVDTKTGKILLPSGCAEDLQKYLELAPDGPHAKEAKSILDSAGLPIKSH